MKFIDPLIQKFKNNFYVRMLTLYSIILIFSLLILFSFFNHYQQKNITAQKISTYTNTVSQFQFFSDQYLLDKIYTIINKDIFKENITSIDAINDPEIYIYNKNNFDKALEFKKFLLNLHSDIDFITSIEIYNKDYDTYISSTAGVFYEVSSNRSEYKNFINYDLINYSLTTENNQFWRTPVDNNSIPNYKDNISFVQLMPIFLSPNQCDIVFIINLNIEKVYNHFFSKINPTYENFKIFDKNNQLLFDTDKKNLYQPDVAHEFIDTINTSDFGNSTLYLDNQKTNVIWTSSTLNDWKYVYTVGYSDLFSALKTSTLYVLVWFLVVFIICLFAVLMISKWLYKPLKQLVSLSKNKVKEIHSDGDIVIISKAFSNLNSKLDQLEGIVQKNDILILNNIIHDLINSKIYTLQDLNERLKILNKEFPYSSFYLLLIKIDEQNFSTLTYDEKELIPLAISELLKDYYSQKYSNPFKMANIFNYEGYFTCIVNLDTKDYPKESEDAKEILALLRTEFSASFNLAISNPIEDLSSFHTYYQAVLGYFKYSFIYGTNNIFTEKIILGYEHSPVKFSTDIIKNFELLLKSNKLDIFKEELTLLFNQITMNGYSYLYTYNLSIQIIGLISRECITQNITSEALSQHILLETFSKLVSLDECLHWFYKVIDEFGTHIEIRNTSIGNSFVQDIIEYIKNNVNSQLSLNSVAEHFGLSTGHLSRLFKEKVGIHFSDFVSQVKFEKATQLLISAPSTKVSDIADQLGYSNLTYFTKLFKEKYGMTPTQYRKSH